MAAGSSISSGSPRHRRRIVRINPLPQLPHSIVVNHCDRCASSAVQELRHLFVEREFREFLTCGCFAAGFARFRCDGCGHDRLVPFSCKARGFSPSCGGRRMAERAAHLVDHVLPDVPFGNGC